jgi:ferredoxin
MKRIRVDSHTDPVEVTTNSRVLDAVLAVQEKLLMACGGKGLCATCHVYVTEGAEKLSPMTPRERMSLPMLADRRPSSRLACQAKVQGEGVRVELPRGRFIDSASDLEALIGRRAEEHIMHPVTGVVLIEAGKLITRSRIRELAFVDVDIAEMKTRSLSIRGGSA